MVELRGINYLNQMQKKRNEEHKSYMEFERKIDAEKLTEISGYISKSTEKFFDWVIYELGKNCKHDQDSVEEEFKHIYQSDRQNFGIIYNALGKFKENGHNNAFCDEVKKAWEEDQYWKLVENKNDLYTMQISFPDLYYYHTYMENIYMIFSSAYLQELCKRLGDGKISTSINEEGKNIVLKLKADLESIKEEQSISSGSSLIKSATHHRYKINNVI